MSISPRMFGVAAAVIIGLGGPAYASVQLESAAPSGGGSVSTSPKQLVLNFSEGVKPGSSGVMLIGPSKTILSTGTAKTGQSGDTSLVVPVSKTLASGTYTVDWHAVSTAGDKSYGSYTFTVK